MSLVNDVIEVTKIEDGAMPAENRYFQVSKVNDDVSKIMGDLGVQHNVEIDVDMSRCEFDSLYGNDTALRQILINLVSNAIKASPNGNVNVQIETHLIRGNDVQTQGNGS